MNKAKVAILLCTYNGEKHLEEQLESIAQQDHQDIDIYVSDDGSTDNTLSILDKYKKCWNKGRFTVKSGPQKGFASNFLSLVCDENLEADFFAYCDQDDIWLTDKLSRSINILSKFRNSGPLLYCSRTSLIKDCGERIEVDSPWFKRKASFQNALVQSLAGGNTMLFNKQTQNLLAEAGELEIVSHDWWTYLLVTGAGGEVVYDPIPSVLYRQHANNEIGANMNWSARMSRIVPLLNGRFKQWNEINTKALLEAKHILIKQNLDLLGLFIELRQTSLLNRLRLAKKIGVYRQTVFGNIALIGATLLKKL